MPKTEEKAYDASSMRVLKGLEPVRERPGMYTRPESPAHIIQEVVDNAADEALAGYAKSIDVEFAADGSIIIADDGRGIPVDLHPEERVPAVTLAFTRLHAGGKFDKKTGGAYAFSGGLHGVGVAVTTALSHRVRVEVSRNSKLYEVEFTDGGRQIGDVKVIGSSERNGTKVQVWPDSKYFDSPTIPRNDFAKLLQSKAVLLPGVTFSMTVDGVRKTWFYEKGMQEFLEEMAGDQDLVAPMYVGEKFQAPSVDGESEASFAPGEGASYAFAWYPDGGVPSPSFVNLIPTKDGGTHVQGLRAGVFEAVKNFIEHRALMPKGIKLTQDDVAGRMAFVLSAKVLDPQFQGQVKDRLNSREAHKLVLQSVKDPFEVWLNNHVEAGTAIADLCIKQAMARSKQGEKIAKRKSSGVVMLPGKLTDCEDTTDNEVFLVEGDSAGGSAKMARNKENQAVLPLRGKVLNTWEVDQNRLFANTEIHDISVAIGVDPHTLESDPAVVLKNLRYSRIMTMTDADVDGAHIQVLLLTLFYRHFPLLITHLKVYIVQPPLYRIDVASGGKNRPAQRLYALDEGEKQSLMAKLAREKVPESRIEVGRFKGLGEMSAEQLKETAMHPDKRRAFPVYWNPETAAATKNTFNLLMAGNQSGGRRQWLSEMGATVDADL